MPAPDQAPSLEAAQCPEDLPPGNGQPLLEVDVSEHQAPAQQQLPRDAPDPLQRNSMTSCSEEKQYGKQ